MTTKIEIADTEGIAEIDDKMTRDLKKLRALIQLRDETNTRLKLSGIAPDFTKKEIERVFSPYGQVKKVTLFRGNPGYGFVEYTTKQEAEMAVNYLANKEFYGQKLEVDFEEESLFSWAKSAQHILAPDDEEEEQVPHPSSSSSSNKSKWNLKQMFESLDNIAFLEETAAISL